ncbi:hypothetical protein BBR47_44640 [Brevibacillus brevis NBRC 100599]|uniref:Uncharacterized protein n=1 Tax=Brevibacillus brevis (strain 47 / JCM 6285 / NBRC 100599) TaxID=358681 RepID=C0ZJ66_BREBN|nr:hypothetical protein BBR47_44640 [Brevibacillus brevis NBRC 100599]
MSHSKNTPGKINGKDDAGHLADDRFEDQLKFTRVSNKILE